ncbi:MAG TPA: hypothetical protein VMZ31_03180 [Phycisphaerae bacterium]|nr:hypothetical protein [Phycisphaerae bacterium]
MKQHRLGRRGILLVELVAMLPAMVAVAGGIALLTLAGLRMTWRIGQWADRDSRLAAFTRQIRTDMESAMAVEPGSEPAASTITLVLPADRRIIYTTAGETVSRRAVPPDAGEPETLTWRLHKTQLKLFVELIGHTALLRLETTLSADRLLPDGRGQRRFVTVFAPGSPAVRGTE